MTLTYGPPPDDEVVDWDEDGNETLADGRRRRSDGAGGYVYETAPSDEYVWPVAPMGEESDPGLAPVIQLRPEPSATLSLPRLPPSFYGSRQVLDHIQRAAYSRNRCPDTSLGGVLTRLAAIRSHRIELDTGIGAPTGLNLFAAVVGPSGAGKSSGLAVASRLLTFPIGVDCPDGFGLGSGEGVVEAYYGVETEEQIGPTGRTRQVKVRRQVRNNVLLAADEGAVFALLGERRGSTLGPHLRSAWSGSAVGQANASEDRQRHLAAGSYSLGLTICFQETTVMPLLDDVAGGTPQRFVYLSATDPSIPDNPPDWPGEIHLDWGRIRPTGRVEMELPLAIRAELRRDDLARMRGEVTVAPFDSHRPLQRLKVAALLALLESRWNVSEEDWQLAEVFVANSDAVRDALLVYARTEAAKEKERKVAEQVDVAVRTAAEVTQIPAAVERVARNIARRVHAAEAAVCSRGDVRRAQKSSDRKFVDAAIDFAEQRGWLRAEDTMLAAGGSRPS